MTDADADAMARLKTDDKGGHGAERRESRPGNTICEYIDYPAYTPNIDASEYRLWDV